LHAWVTGTAGPPGHSIPALLGENMPQPQSTWINSISK
jgi:hypothetical protein